MLIMKNSECEIIYLLYCILTDNPLFSLSFKQYENQYSLEKLKKKKKKKNRYKIVLINKALNKSDSVSISWNEIPPLNTDS